MAGLFSCLARQSPGGHVLERDGVMAAVVPECPDRSVVNCVVYSDTSALEAALGEIAEEYERAGVRAWTVWAPEHDREAAELLERAGNRLDARPAAMACDLDEVVTAPSDALDLDLLDADMGEVARVNDAAYGFAGDFERAFKRLPPEPAHVYLARAEGVPACTLVTYEEDGECGVYLVATLPEARGRGLASALMIHALNEARERGCTTSSLQATRRGRPVYARLGYADIGAVHMWEKRRSV